MIAPDMATMLAFVFTDAPIAAPRAAGAAAARRSTTRFNAVTIDGDTSTSDTLLAVRDRRRAQRRAENRKASDRAPRRLPRRRSTTVLADLAEQVVRDGEGARKLVEIDGRGRGLEAVGAPDRDVDRQFAAGQDRDRRRGRQLGPRRHGGRQGRRAGRPRQARRSGSAASASRTRARAIPAYDEAKVVRGHEERRRSRSRSISGSAAASDRVLTCDLTKEYVAINGDYRSKLVTSGCPAFGKSLIAINPASVPRSYVVAKLVLVAACALIDADGRVLIARAAARQGDGRPVGVSRRQGRAGRDGPRIR